MTYNEMRRLLKQMGAKLEEGSKHTKVYLNDKQTTLPRHGKGEMGEGYGETSSNNSESRSRPAGSGSLPQVDAPRFVGRSRSKHRNPQHHKRDNIQRSGNATVSRKDPR